MSAYYKAHQRKKRWHKKPKVDVNNPNKEFTVGSHTYMNASWMFNNKNRDRPGGHTAYSYENGYMEGYKKHRMYKRENHRFFILEGLADFEDQYTDEDREQELYELEQEQEMMIFYQQEEERQWREDYEELRHYEEMAELEDRKYEMFSGERQYLEDAMDAHY